MRSVKHSGKLAMVTALLHWWKCLEFCGKKPFIISNASMCPLFSYSFSFDLSLIYGGHCFLVWLPSKVMRGFTHHVRFPTSRNNAPQHIKMFPDSLIAASWHLPVCCNRESTERVLELLKHLRRQLCT